MADSLQEHGVKLLLEVRAGPRSRIPGFNQHQLARFLATQGIAYRHLEALGNSNRNAGPDAPVALFDAEQGIAALFVTLEPQLTAIKCAEKSYVRCHRTYIVQRVEDLTVLHI